MGFRPTLFTCIAHLLYCTLCLLYKRHLCIFYWLRIQYNLPVFLTWYQSHCSNIFLAVLSLLALLHSQYRFHRHNSCRSLSSLNLQRLPAVVLEFQTCSRCRWGVLHYTDYCTCCHRCLYCSDCISRGITKIIFNRSTRRWKPCSHRSLQALSHAAQRFCVSALRVPRVDKLLHALPCADYILHAPPRARSALADVSPKWRHHCHVTCWHHRPHLLTSPTTSADIIVDKLLTWVDFDWGLILTVDFFARVDFCSPGAPYPVFHVDFIFAIHFCIFCF